MCVRIPNPLQDILFIVVVANGRLITYATPKDHTLLPMGKVALPRDTYSVRTNIMSVIIVYNMYVCNTYS